MSRLASSLSSCWRAWSSAAVVLGLAMLPAHARAQAKLDLSPGHACAGQPFALPPEVYIFDPSQAASSILKNLVNSIGASASNLKLQASNVPNALAYLDPVSSARLILYNEDFVQKLEGTSGSAWAAKALLAHELGHHLNGHLQIAKPDRRRVEELESDKFAGFLLFKLGASIEAVTEVFQSLSEGEGYPPRTARIAAATSGWWSAKEQSGYQRPNSPPLTAEQRSIAGRMAPPDPPVPADPREVQDVELDGFQLEIMQQGSMVPHAGNLPAGPGLRFKLRGKLTLPEMEPLSIAVHFTFPNGQPLVPYPGEFHYRTSDQRLATGVPMQSVESGEIDLSTLVVDPIPYYVLNLLPTGFRQSYPIRAQADLFIGESRLIERSSPVEFVVQW